jgi:hypothetical protein
MFCNRVSAGYLLKLKMKNLCCDSAFAAIPWGEVEAGASTTHLGSLTGTKPFVPTCLVR